MANVYMPRAQVHEWSEAIGEDQESHQTALPRLLKANRRLTRFLEENAENLNPATAGVTLYLFGVVARMFELAGGRLKNATWEQVRAAEKRVGGAVGGLLPLDDGFRDRLRAVDWRAQPHILDEAILALFDSDQGEEDVDLDKSESLKVFFLMWVATEVLDENWQPPKGFSGDTSYEYVHIEPKPPAKGEDAAEE